MSLTRLKGWRLRGKTVRSTFLKPVFRVPQISSPKTSRSLQRESAPARADQVHISPISQHLARPHPKIHSRRLRGARSGSTSPIHLPSSSGLVFVSTARREMRGSSNPRLIPVPVIQRKSEWKPGRGARDTGRRPRGRDLPRPRRPTSRDTSHPAEVRTQPPDQYRQAWPTFFSNYRAGRRGRHVNRRRENGGFLNLLREDCERIEELERCDRDDLFMFSAFRFVPTFRIRFF